MQQLLDRYFLPLFLENQLVSRFLENQYLEIPNILLDIQRSP